MTHKIYYDDPHISTFTATVSECINEGDGFDIVLDRTAFFPEEGGQCCDRGTINGMEVKHVSIKGDVIFHRMDTAIPAGTQVSGEIDYALRFDNEQQHSGEHILSGLANSLYGCTNVGFRLASDITTLDFDKALTDEQIENLETKANEAVFKNLEILCGFPEPEVLKNLEYRSKLELTENVRIVTIPGVDVCACCAPHVDHTGQIGLIKIIKREAWKGGVRLTILCGARALAFFRTNLATVNELTRLTSASADNLPKAVTELKEKADKAEAAKNLTESLMLEELLKTATPGTPLFVPAFDTRNIRNAINKTKAAASGICAVFAGTGASYNFLAAGDNGGCKALAALLRDRLGAKCGGSDTMIQGTVEAESKAIAEVFASL